MQAQDAYSRALRFAPLGVWALFSIPLVLAWVRNRQNAPPNVGIFLAAFAILGIAFAITSGSRTTWTLRQFVALGVQSSSILVMSYVDPSHVIGFLFVLVAWQLALYLPLPAVLIWVVLHTSLLLAIYAHAFSLGEALAPIGVNAGFQAFAVIAAFFTKSQIRAGENLSSLNAELQSTRELVAESTRLNERMRISRDLHDMMGHNLTALSIHLEVARHLVAGQAQDHLLKARALSKTLLGDVRAIVSATRSADVIDITRAVEALCERIPNLRLHTELPGNLAIEDPQQAQVFLRCIQEVVTNALRHSEAENLWIQVTPRDGGFLIDARDDGIGSPEPKPGLGLSNMSERLEEIGGWLKIESEPTRGFAIKAWLPAISR